MRAIHSKAPKQDGPPTKISTDEYAIYAADFADYDTNGNGVLDADEMRSLIKFQFNKDPNEQELKDFLSVLDQNSDGKIDLSEYLDHILGPGWTTYNEEEREERKEHEEGVKESIETEGE